MIDDDDQIWKGLELDEIINLNENKRNQEWDSETPYANAKYRPEHDSELHNFNLHSKNTCGFGCLHSC